MKWILSIMTKRRHLVIIRSRLYCCLGLVLIIGCSTSNSGSVTERVLSPGGGYEAVFAPVSDEGATGQGPMGLYLVAKGASPSPESLIVEGYQTASVDGRRAFGLKWESDQKLIVSTREGKISNFSNYATVSTKSGPINVGIRLETLFYPR